jgi:hypothetical protein
VINHLIWLLINGSHSIIIINIMKPITLQICHSFDRILSTSTPSCCHWVQSKRWRGPASRSRPRSTRGEAVDSKRPFQPSAVRTSRRPLSLEVRDTLRRTARTVLWIGQYSQASMSSGTTKIHLFVNQVNVYVCFLNNLFVKFR